MKLPQPVASVFADPVMFFSHVQWCSSREIHGAHTRISCLTIGPQESKHPGSSKEAAMQCINVSRVASLLMSDSARIQVEIGRHLQIIYSSLNGLSATHVTFDESDSSKAIT